MKTSLFGILLCFFFSSKSLAVQCRNAVTEAFHLGVIEGIGSHYELVPLNAGTANDVYQVVDRAGQVLGYYKITKPMSRKNLPGLVEPWAFKLAFESGGMATRAELAYQIANTFGFEFVPFTKFIKGVDGEKAIYQAALSDYKLAADMVATNKEVFAEISVEDIQKVILFEVLVGTQDRNMENWMISTESSQVKIGLIDSDRILLRTGSSWLQVPLPLEGLLSQAMGEVDPIVSETFMKIGVFEFDALMQAYEIPADARSWARGRLQYLKDSLARGEPLEEIYQGIRPNSFSLSLGRLGRAYFGFLPRQYRFRTDSTEKKSRLTFERYTGGDRPFQ